MNVPPVATITQGVWETVVADLARMTELRNLYARAEADANWRHGQTIVKLDAVNAKAKALRAVVAKVEQFLFVGTEFGYNRSVIMPLIDELQAAFDTCAEAGALENVE